MQMQFLLVLSTLLDVLNAIYLNDEDEITKRSIRKKDQEFEPITISKKSEKLTTTSNNFNCDEFSSYAVNCTNDAAFIYNTSRMSPPSPTKINDWCRAIKHLTNCAIDWNIDCRHVTDNHFNEESIKGHIHVVNNICEDEWFLMQYEELSVCIEEASERWESCYLTFKNSVEEQKNSTQDWTHYEVHFHLCCARTRFRRCTLESIFAIPKYCFHDQAVTLQKFSVIVSEGNVYQDCDLNMMYAYCPGGDPRPIAISYSSYFSIFSFEVEPNNRIIDPIFLYLNDCDLNMMYANCPGGDPRPTELMLKRLVKTDGISYTTTLRSPSPIYLPIITLFFSSV